MTGAAVRQTRGRVARSRTTPVAEEDTIDALWPRTAPPTVKAAVAGLFVLVALLVVNIVTVVLVEPRGEVIVEDVVIAVAVTAIVVGINRRATWSRYTGVAVAALFAIGAVSLFQPGVPGVFIVAGIVQVVVLVAVVVLLLVRPTSDWYRYGA